jgi:phage-related protein
MGPDLLDAALIIIESLASGLAENLDTIIPAVTSMILEIANVLVTHVDDIIAVGFQLFSSLVQGILQALPVIIQQLPFLLEGLINGCMAHLPEIVQMWVDLMSCLGEALPDIVDSLLQVLPELLVQIIEYWTGPGAAQLLSAALKMWEALTKALVMIVARVIAGIGTLVRNIGAEIGGAAGKVLSSAKKMFEGLFTAAKDIMTKVKTGISDGFNTVISFIKGLGSKMAEAGKNLITGLWNGIKGAFDSVVEKVKKLVEKLPTAVKKVLGIKSPSTVFAEIGGYLAEGLGVGWEDSMKKVNAEIGKDLNYKGNIEVDSTFKDDFSEGMKVAANSLGTAVPVATQPDETNLSGATIIINDRITLDGTPLKDVVAEYTIKKMGNDVRAMKVSRGGSNVL